eukprot:6204957-Pleurochrysis_carterae.AAC.1
MVLTHGAQKTCSEEYLHGLAFEQYTSPRVGWGGVEPDCPRRPFLLALHVRQFRTLCRRDLRRISSSPLPFVAA